MEKLNETSTTHDETPENDNDQVWQKNHTLISNFIRGYVMMESAMPNKSVIAKGTGLCRETIYKHLNGYSESLVKQNTGSYEMMVEQVTLKVLKAALAGDLKAVKLFLEMRQDFTKPKAEVATEVNK